MAYYTKAPPPGATLLLPAPSKRNPRETIRPDDAQNQLPANRTSNGYFIEFALFTTRFFETFHQFENLGHRLHQFGRDVVLHLA